MLALIRINHTFGLILTLGLGIFVLTRDVKNGINRIYFLLCLCLASWVMANLLIYIGPFEPIFGYRLAIFFGSFQAPTLLLFSWVFPKKEARIKFQHVIIIYAVGFLFSIFSFSDFYLQKLIFLDPVNRLKMVTSFGIGYYLFTVFFLSFAIASAVNFIKSYRTIKSSAERIRAGYCLLGLFLAYGVSITFGLILSVLGNETYEYLSVLGPNIFVLFSAYAIVKHRLMDIQLIIKKGLIYSVIIGLFTGMYLTAIFTLSHAFQIFTGHSSTLIAIILLLLFAMVLQPLRNKVQLLVDKLFFKEKYDYQRTLKNLSQMIGSMVELDVLLKQVIATIDQAMKVDAAAIYVVNREEGNFKLRQALAPKNN